MGLPTVPLRLEKRDFQRWVAGGVFTEMFRWSAAEYEELEGFELTWRSMDGSLVQAPIRQARCRKDEGLGRNPTDRGRSGGKIHLQVDGRGMPFAVVQAGANVHDSRLVTVTVKTGVIAAPADAERGPRHLCLDKGYGYERVWREVASFPTSAGSARRSALAPGKPTPRGGGWWNANSTLIRPPLTQRHRYEQRGRFQQRDSAGSVDT